MGGDSHHFGGTVETFGVEGIESAFDVVVEIGGGTEAGWDVEFEVIAVVGVGN